MGDDVDVERVEPWLHPGLRRVARWRRGHFSHWACQHLTVGQLPDGRWYVELSGRAHAYPTEDQARDAAGRWMAADTEQPWIEVPPEYGPDGQPTQPGWVRRGGGWVRDQPS